MHSALSAQLEAAVLALVGHGALKDRLCAAYCDHLDDIREQDLPEEVQREFSLMSRAMHAARALPGDSVVRASVRKFSNEQAQAFAALIVRTYVLRVQEPGRHSGGSGTPRQPVARGASAAGAAGSRGRRAAVYTANGSETPDATRS